MEAKNKQIIKNSTFWKRPLLAGGCFLIWKFFI